MSVALQALKKKIVAFRERYATAEAISQELRQQVTSLQQSLLAAETSSTRLSERLSESLALSRRLESEIRRLKGERYWWAVGGAVAGGALGVLLE